MFLIDHSGLFCKQCGIKAIAEKCFTVSQNVETEKHIISVNRIDKP